METMKRRRRSAKERGTLKTSGAAGQGFGFALLMTVAVFALATVLPQPVLADVEEAPVRKALSDKSPFLPPGHGEKPDGAKPPPVVDGPLSREIEFRGVVHIGDKYQFSFFSKKENKSYWIAENTSISGMSARGYDARNGTVVFSKDGRSERLTMLSATDSPLPVALSTVAKDPGTTPVVETTPRVTPPREDNRRVVPRRRVILPQSN